MFQVGDIIDYYGSTGVVVKESEHNYFIHWFGDNGKPIAYLKVYHSRSFVKVS